MGKVDILDVAKLVICKFNNSNDNRVITQLKLQKMLYFIEAYYMAVYNKDALYNDDFYAWTYGPVCKRVYDKYKIFMDSPIIESCELNTNIIDTDIIDSIDNIFDNFGHLSATSLIRLTHLKNSPWYNTKKTNNTPINKKETKEWFRKVFLISR